MPELRTLDVTAASVGSAHLNAVLARPQEAPVNTFEIVRDGRGSVVHVRRRDSGECLGCVEVGLYEVIRALIVEQTRRSSASRSASVSEPVEKLLAIC